ncbi:MAG TPA: VWA domain-containing protein [Candidatus Saccharimonadales bacterium]|nr:VWA domain-containing protein [Candidatus Saccharimonadales bacterium]
MMTQASKSAAVVLSFGLALSLGAQEKPDRPPWAQPPGSSSSQTQSAPAPGQGKPVEPSSPRNTVKVQVNLVNVLVSVLDEHNRPAPNLPADAFQIFEEGAAQKLDVFEQETKQPLDIALMIDTSLSAHKEIVFERDAAANFIKQVLRPDDSLSVFAFDESVTQVAKFSSDVTSLQSAVHKITDGSGTSIYDAIFLGSRALNSRPNDRRRVIIMVTDGGETTSRTDFESARKSALRAGLLLYTIIVRPVKNENGRNTAGEHALETITETTGGAMFFPESMEELPIIFDRIDAELRTQYRLAYYPNPRGPANTYRTIEVKVLPGYTARHRTTYLTGPQ